MVTSVTAHYRDHLAPVYSWMVGDFDSACYSAREFLEQIELLSDEGDVAVDLGCGHGIYSVALANQGYRVIAVDSSSHLLDELRQRSDLDLIRPVLGDLTRFDQHLDGEAVSAVVCMGDTLTHLESIDAVQELIQNVSEILPVGGIFAVSFRDYTTSEFKGAQRFIPVKSDANRIHTCFLEYLKDRVIVHDILQTRSESGWEQSVSAYPKLRLSTEEVLSFAKRKGLGHFHRSEVRGMVFLAFSKSL